MLFPIIHDLFGKIFLFFKSTFKSSGFIYFFRWVLDRRHSYIKWKETVILLAAEATSSTPSELITAHALTCGCSIDLSIPHSAGSLHRREKNAASLCLQAISTTPGTCGLFRSGGGDGRVVHHRPPYSLKYVI